VKYWFPFTSTNTPRMPSSETSYCGFYPHFKTFYWNFFRHNKTPLWLIHHDTQLINKSNGNAGFSGERFCHLLPRSNFNLPFNLRSLLINPQTSFSLPISLLIVSSVFCNFSIVVEWGGMVILQPWAKLEGTTGRRSGASPSSRLARRRGGLGFCHTQNRVNTVWLKQTKPWAK
jgi:hypothetical protein